MPNPRFDTRRVAGPSLDMLGFCLGYKTGPAWIRTKDQGIMSSLYRS